MINFIYTPDHPQGTRYFAGVFLYIKTFAALLISKPDYGIINIVMILNRRRR